MSELELQAEEREVLLSIYDGDTAFKEINPTTFQYKYGEDETLKSFILELKWGTDYPNQAPEVNMDTFYNKHIGQASKQRIVKLINEETEQYLGMSMTYSLFEFIKEKFEELIEDQPEVVDVPIEKLTITTEQPAADEKGAKKEQLTKSQKRRQWSRLDNKGEKPRGWNWVDLVKHLSQTGGKETTSTAT